MIADVPRLVGLDMSSAALPPGVVAVRAELVRRAAHVGRDVGGLKIPKLPVRLIAPAQEPADHTGPLLECRWCEAALFAHPSHILIELALILKPATRFTPPAEK